MSAPRVLLDLSGGRTAGVVEKKITPVGFEPTPFRNGALSHRLRPLGQTVLSGHYK